MGLVSLVVTLSVFISPLAAALNPPENLHIWGKDGLVLANNSIHTDTLLGNSDLILALSLSTKKWFSTCADCEDTTPTQLKYITIRLDKDPEVIAMHVVEKFRELGYDVTSTHQTLNKMVADAQLHHFLTIVTQLQFFLVDKGFDNWEGGTTAFLPKMRMMRELVLRPHVKTVCEIGFNNGASTLMWLVSGANKVLSFDIGSHGYTTHAVDWLSQRFPGRFQVILGDSQYTVPSFHQMFSDEKCDLIFIDGGHTYDIALKDLVNFRALAREEKHILLMDDVLYDVARAWDIAIEKGLVVEEVREYSDVWSDGYSQPFSSHLDYNGGRLRNDPLVSHAEFPSAMSYGSYTSRKRN